VIRSIFAYPLQSGIFDMFSDSSSLPNSWRIFLNAIVVPKDGAHPQTFNSRKNARFLEERIQKEAFPGMLTGWQCAK
jgi:hypothetical protein